MHFFLQKHASLDYYVPIRVNSNKAYTVFVEGAAIGYTLGAIGDESTDLGSTYLYTLEGAGEYNYLSEANITHVEFAEREYLKLFKPDVYDSRLTDDIWNSITVQGNGFIKFPVYKDCQYIVNANGSKIVIGGFVFSSEAISPYPLMMLRFILQVM